VWLAASRGVSNYTTLFDQVDRYRTGREPVLLVTFNYDLMLEDALKHRGQNISEMPDYLAGADYKLIKAHGSANWGRQIVGRFNSVPQHVDPMVIANRNIEKIDEIQVADSYIVVPRDPPFASPAPDHPMALFPAIAIPVHESKTEFECPPAHIAALRNLLPRTTKILTIGWRARERHFLRLLKELNVTSPWVHAVAKDEEEAAATLKELQNGGIFGPHSASKCRGFSEFVVSGEIKEFIQRGDPAAVAAG
jgi:hypothetical protein